VQHPLQSLSMPQQRSPTSSSTHQAARPIPLALDRHLCFQSSHAVALRAAAALPGAAAADGLLRRAGARQQRLRPRSRARARVLAARVVVTAGLGAAGGGRLDSGSA
jgi:hypothetical protein